MTRIALHLGRYALLVAVTVAAGFVMWWVSRPNTEASVLGGSSEIAGVTLSAAPKTAVFIERIEPERCDVSVRYSGKIEAWETYSVGFEVGGRVATLGRSAAGEPLDDGDRVESGQLLARLDDRILLARRSEAAANYELAVSELERSKRIRKLNPGALPDGDYQVDLTEVALMKAMQEVAQKNLEDATISSPVSGSIVRRMVEVGESVNPHSTIFDIVENDRLRLVLNVPEARVREMEIRRRRVFAARRGEAPVADPEDAVFRARVRLEGTDVYGRPWPAIDAEVYRIAEVADAVTGLFEVEVLIPNEEGLLRPGMVATAEVVTDRILAYRAPEASVLFRADQTFLYTVSPQTADLKVMFWEVGQTDVMRAERRDLTTFIDQGDAILLPASSLDLDSVVVRGQQRLRDGQLVRIVNEEAARAPSSVGVAGSETARGALN